MTDDTGDTEALDALCDRLRRWDITDDDKALCAAVITALRHRLKEADARAEAETAALTADLDWLKRSIFGGSNYHPSAVVGQLAEMAQSLRAACEGGQETIARLTAERDASVAGAVRVKPLVWEECSTGPRLVKQSATAFGSYRVTQRFSPETFFHVETPDGAAFNADCLASAQATAQADYEARILAALEPAKIVEGAGE